MENVDYVNNPNQRTPCVLVLDASGSMYGNRIEELNAGMVEFERQLKDDPSALTRVQLAIICVGGPRSEASILMDWTDCANFTAFPLVTGGNTPLGEGLLLGLDLIESGKQNLRSAGISYTRPWMFVISDGEPTTAPETWQIATQKCKDAEAQNKLEIFSIAVAGANTATLSSFSKRPAMPLQGTNFRELFVWLTGTLKSVSNTRPGDTVALPSTDPWRFVGV